MKFFNLFNLASHITIKKKVEKPSPERQKKGENKKVFNESKIDNFKPSIHPSKLKYEVLMMAE